jgi:hypothetical protein
MEWRDEGIVIGLRRHGETSSIVEAMTRVHGRHMGLVRGGRAPRLGAALQPGNSLGLVWRARLDEHLGVFRVEPLSLRAGRLLSSALALAGLGYLGALLRLLPERDPHEGLFDALSVIVDHLDDPSLAPALVARFRGADTFGERLCARSRGLRGDRRARGSRLCLPQVRPGGERERWRALARQAPAAAGFPQARRRRADARRR